MFYLFVFVSLTLSCTDEKEQNITSNDFTTEIRSSDCGSAAQAAQTQPGCQLYIQNYTLIYQGCAIPYSVTFAHCYGGITIDPPVYDQSLLCPNIVQMIADAYGIGNAQAAADIFNNIATSISLHAQQTILTNAQGGGYYSLWRCQNSNPNNPCQGRVSTIRAFETTCSSVCARRIKGDLPGPIQYVTCGTACCERRTRFCIRYDNTPCFENPEIISSGNCQMVPWPEFCNNSPECNGPCDKLEI